MNKPHASRMPTVIDIRRGRVDDRLAKTAAATNARHSTGMAWTYNMKPIMPLAIDGWTTRDVAARPAAINAMAPSRSRQAARLRNSHQTITSRLPAIPPRIAAPPASGETRGTPKRATSRITAATTPGHSRSGGWNGPSLTAAVISPPIAELYPVHDFGGIRVSLMAVDRLLPLT